MAAVPTGPSAALPAAPAEICLFPGDGCTLPGEGETVEWELEDAVISDIGPKQEVGECKVEREGNQKFLFSDVHPHCQALERKVNGLSCIGLAGFRHSTEPGSHDQTPAMELHGDRLCFPHHDINTNGDSSIHDRLPFSRTEDSQCPCHMSEVCVKGDSVSPPCPGPEEVVADGPLEEFSRLDLNHSPSRETGRVQEIKYVRYESELQMPGIMRLITKDLSEPYSIYTYRYFIHNWPQLCFLVRSGIPLWAD